MPNIRLEAFNYWLDHPELGSELVYHRGELGRDAEHDPALAALAAEVRARSTGEFDEVSRCGHVRNHTSGDHQVEATCYRERHQQVFIVRRRPA